MMQPIVNQSPSPDSSQRLPLPEAYLDPAFLACVYQAFETPELVRQFDRLYGADLSHHRTPIEQMIDQASGKRSSDMGAFTRFVHESIYMRVTDEAIVEMRGKAPPILADVPEPSTQPPSPDAQPESDV